MARNFQIARCVSYLLILSFQDSRSNYPISTQKRYHPGQVIAQ